MSRVPLNPTALASREQPEEQMSAKGNKAKASKDVPKDPTPKRAPSAGRLPARSPLDDGMRSQMFNLSPALSQQRRSNSPLLPGLRDPPPKNRKAKVSLEDTLASAASKSSSAEDTLPFASAANKSSSAEDISPIRGRGSKAFAVEQQQDPREGALCLRE